MDVSGGNGIRVCASREELTEVVELLARSFTNTPRDYFERHVLRDPTLSPADTLVAVRDGRIVSTVQIFPRVMMIAGKPIPFGGIGNVGTDPSERKGGQASALMIQAVALMGSRGYPFSMLTTTINAYYERFGYKTVERDAVTIDVNGMKVQPDVTPVNMPREMQEIMALYQEYNADATGPLIRDLSYWNAQREFCGEEVDKFLVIRRKGELAGYIRNGIIKGVRYVLEYAARGDVPEIVERLLISVSALTGGKPMKLFLSNEEHRRLALRLPHSTSTNTDLMIAVLQSSFHTSAGAELLRRNNITFWLTDLL